MGGFGVFVVLAMLATVVALGMGIVSMARGGEYDQQHGTQLMGWRVGLQAATLVLLVVALIVAYS